MAKDPAFLFYYQDFIVGTTFMTNEQVGAYIKTLCHLADKGQITDKQLLMVCGDVETAGAILEKLQVLKDGVFYSERLNEEVEKRKNFSESRRKNRKAKNTSETYDKHMEDENENEDINRIEIREEIFKSEVQNFKNYPTAMLNEFIEYWTEPNKSGSRMKFEMEKTWDLKRRLSRWSNNSFNKVPAQKKPQQSSNFNRILNEDYDKRKPKSIKEILE